MGMCQPCGNCWQADQQTDSLSDLLLLPVLILLHFETHTRILHLLSSTNMRKAILVLRSWEWYNTLQQYSPRQLHITKFTSCFGDLAHRQGVSYPSLIQSGAAAALDFWTVSPCLKFHFKLPPCLPHFPDHQLFNAKQNTCPILQLLWWWDANFCNKCTKQILELPAHQLLQDFPRSPQCSEASTGHSKLWLGLLSCVDSDEVIPPPAGCQIMIWGFLLLGWGFFPVGKRLL